MDHAKVLAALVLNEAIKLQKPITELAQFTGVSDIRGVLRGQRRMKRETWNKLEKVFPGLRGLVHYPTPTLRGGRKAEPNENGAEAYEKLKASKAPLLYTNTSSALLPNGNATKWKTHDPAKCAKKGTKAVAKTRGRKKAELPKKPPMRFPEASETKLVVHRPRTALAARVSRKSKKLVSRMPVSVIQDLVAVARDQMLTEKLIRVSDWLQEGGLTFSSVLRALE